MPYINRLPAKKTRWKKHSNSRKRNRTEKEKMRVKLYNNSKWKKMRLGYLIYHPICEMCEKEAEEKGEIAATPATDVHHINSPFDDGLSEDQRLGRLLDPNNLMALCQYHHGLIHFQQQNDK